MVIIFGSLFWWMVVGSLWLTWLALKYSVIATYWTLKALVWLTFTIVIPGVVILAVCLYFAWWKWVWPVLRPSAPKKETDRPVWRGWRPSQ